MTLFKKTFLAALIASAASSAFAGNSADLTVIGTITPVACTPAFVGGGVVDYGNISPSALSRTADTALEMKSVNYTITCDSPVAMATRWIDARTGTSGTLSKYMKFGLGKAGDVKIGGYNLTEQSADVLADGGSISLVSSQDNGVNWNNFNTGKVDIAPNGKNIKAYAKVGTLIPAAYKTIAGKVNVEVFIAPTADFDFSQDIKLDGLATMEVIYL